MCSCICAHVYQGVCIHVRVCRPEDNAKGFLTAPHLYLLRLSLMDPGDSLTCLDWLARGGVGRSNYLFSCLCFSDVMPGLLCGFWRSELGPHACGKYFIDWGFLKVSPWPIFKSFPSYVTKGKEWPGTSSLCFSLKPCSSKHVLQTLSALFGAGEATQRLRTLTALTGDPRSPGSKRQCLLLEHGLRD